MERVWSTDLINHAGRHVRLAGWLHRYRQLSHVGFLVLRDARGLVQIVVDDPETAALLGRLANESVLSITGQAVANPQAPGGAEVHQSEVTVLSDAVPPPFDLFRPTLAAQLPTILDNAPVALRHPAVRARHRLAAALTEGFRAALTADGFTEIHTPKIVAAATESGANVFPIDYFGRTAYLAQSPQLYKQVMVGVFERVFETAPVFRAEPHDTPRHLNEYISLDAELGFIADERDVMAVLGRTLRSMFERLPDRLGADLVLAGAILPTIPDEIPAIYFTDARSRSRPRGDAGVPRPVPALAQFGRVAESQVSFRVVERVEYNSKHERANAPRVASPTEYTDKNQYTFANCTSDSCSYSVLTAKRQHSILNSPVGSTDDATRPH